MQVNIADMRLTGAMNPTVPTIGFSKKKKEKGKKQLLHRCSFQPYWCSSGTTQLTYRAACWSAATDVLFASVVQKLSLLFVLLTCLTRKLVTTHQSPQQHIQRNLTGLGLVIKWGISVRLHAIQISWELKKQQQLHGSAGWSRVSRDAAHVITRGSRRKQNGD